MTSRIMGFARDMIVAGYFGASASLDGFFVAFRIPNLLRRLLAEGALTVSFVPVYTEYLANRGRAEALELAQKTLSLLLLALCAVTALGLVFSPQVISLFAYGFTSADVVELTTRLGRIMFPYLVCAGLAAFAMGVLNSHGHFFAPAFSPVLLNAGFITGVVWLSAFFAEPLYGPAWGVILGGALQVLLQLPYMARSGFRMRFSLDLKHPGVRRIARLLGPAVFGIAIYQINIFVSTVLASKLPEGCISYLYYSDRLTEIVMGVFIVSIGNVVLPEMSRLTAMKDTAGLREIHLRAVSAALFVSVPAAAALMVIGRPIVSVLFMRGAFTAHDADMVAKALFYASLGIGPLAVLRITIPALYSLKDARSPVRAAALSFALNIALGYLLMRTPLRHAGLTLANSVAAAAQAALLIFFLKRRTGGVMPNRFAFPLLKILFASGVMAAVLFYFSSLTDWMHDPFAVRSSRLALMIAAGAAAYFLCCAVTGVREIRFLLERAMRRR
jgi:putative peptidoglycan lipid II flippase